MRKHRSGFTLLELLVVIILLGVLAALISGNFLSSLKKGRDARRKSDLESIQKSLEMYYEDKKAYPLDSGPSGLVLNTSTQITDSVSGKVYMYQVPKDPTSSYYYVYTYHASDDVSGNGEGYELFSTLENSLDVGPGVKVSGGTQVSNGYGNSCGGGSVKCKYKIASYNYP